MSWDVRRGATSERMVSINILIKLGLVVGMSGWLLFVRILQVVIKKLIEVRGKYFTYQAY